MDSDDQALLSIVTPAFEPKFIAATALSISAQDLENVEWIVVNDGSSPRYSETFERLKATEGVDVRIVGHPEPQGAASARNTGLAHASGAFVKFLDADDTLPVGHLTTLIELAKTLPNHHLPFAPTEHVFPSRRFINKSFEGIDQELQLARMIARPFCHHSGVLWSQEALSRVGDYDASLVTDEDGDLLLRASLAGYIFVPAPTTFEYQHRTDSGRLSKDDTPSKIESRLKVCSLLEERLRTHPSHGTPVEMSALATRYDSVAVAGWQVARETALEATRRAHSISVPFSWSGTRFQRLLRPLEALAGLAPPAWPSARSSDV